MLWIQRIDFDYVFMLWAHYILVWTQSMNKTELNGSNYSCIIETAAQQKKNQLCNRSQNSCEKQKLNNIHFVVFFSRNTEGVHWIWFALGVNHIVAHYFCWFFFHSLSNNSCFLRFSSSNFEVVDIEHSTWCVPIENEQQRKKLEHICVFFFECHWEREIESESVQCKNSWFISSSECFCFTTESNG